MKRMLSVLVLLACAGRAVADEWYGWQSALLDAGAVGLALAGKDVAPFGGVVFILGAPLVHVVHGQGGRGLLSFGARSVVPILIFSSVIGAGEGHEVGTQIALLGAGLAAFVLADDILLARRVTPTVMPLPDGGASLGIAGRF